MFRRIHHAYTSLAEQTSTTYTRLTSTLARSSPDLDLLILNATIPDDSPVPDPLLHHLSTILHTHPSSTRSFSLSFSRRFRRTRSSRVALKCLFLLHRLLVSLHHHPSFRSDLLWSLHNNLLILHHPSSHFTPFIRSYANLLDEALHFFDHHSSPDETKIKQASRAIESLPQLQSLIDCAIECRPDKNPLVRAAMRLIVRQSFDVYALFQKEMAFVLDNLLLLPYGSCVDGLGAYRRASAQAYRLREFYGACREAGICGPYEYPVVELIPHIHVRAMESLVDGMWQLTESESESSYGSVNTVTTSSSTMSPFMSSDGESMTSVLLMVGTPLKAVTCMEWERFEEEEEEEGDDGWEELLEASIDGSGEWGMKVYNPYPWNPFYEGGVHHFESSWRL
ncbi:hypothetical protein QJS04_geneDACA017447 [Acorus gramineus]|uniref:ENTH domain-containing protein n=1 Tax=Acorus gramineus TaxID=55184 RepID=A0AAV9AHR7_ACOGR|nr:hypothetical protein QJS04_geneDACA017447 [Acorus gramineus]